METTKEQMEMHFGRLVRVMKGFCKKKVGLKRTQKHIIAKKKNIMKFHGYMKTEKEAEAFRDRIKGVRGE